MPAPPQVVALVPAAGRGERFQVGRGERFEIGRGERFEIGRGERLGAGLAKQFVPIAGRPVLVWTLERLLACGVAAITVALPAEEVAGAPSLFAAGLRRPEAAAAVPLRWVAGGASRQESVALCLAATPGGAEDLVLVHDGARPAVAVEDVAATIAAALEADGAILGRPMDDTVKRTAAGLVVGTLERGDLFRAETPQVFRRRVLERAVAEARAEGRWATDEAALVEGMAGVRVRAVAASWPNPKLTRPSDVAWLTGLLAP